MARIGFIGLGHMGLPMACNLLKAGHQVIAYDLQPAALQAFKEAKGKTALRLSEAVIGQEVIITMLQTGQQVLQVYESPEGLLKQAGQGSLLIDCSTIDVETARTVHRLAHEQGLLAVDAPVSGGVAGAVAASLCFMLGGEEPIITKARPYLSAMGKKIIHTGGPGSGQAAKICNNMILGMSMIAVSEAFVLAKSLGLSSQKLFEVVNNASGQCWTMSNYVPVPGILDKVPANNEYKPGFTALMMLKDLKLSQESAQLADIHTCLAEKATEIYQNFVTKGFGELDFSAIIRSLE